MLYPFELRALTRYCNRDDLMPEQNHGASSRDPRFKVSGSFYRHINWSVTHQTSPPHASRSSVGLPHGANDSLCETLRAKRLLGVFLVKVKRISELEVLTLEP